LTSFGRELLVLSPENVQGVIIERIEKMMEGYGRVK